MPGSDFWLQSEIESLLKGEQPRALIPAEQPRIGPAGSQLPPLDWATAAASSDEVIPAAASSTPANGGEPFIVIHHTAAHYELRATGYKFRGPAQIICINERGNVVFHEYVTLASDEIRQLPLQEGQHDPYEGN